MTLRGAGYDDPEAQVLIAELLADLASRYDGEGDETPVDPAQFQPPHGLFLVAGFGGVPIGCAGLRRHRDAVVELKRMYIRPGHRRRGHARRLLAAVEDRARAMGYRRVILETGTGQPESMALYESCGFERIPNFGYYAQHDDCVCYGKQLSAAG